METPKRSQKTVAVKRVLNDIGKEFAIPYQLTSGRLLLTFSIYMNYSAKIVEEDELGVLFIYRTDIDSTVIIFKGYVL